MILLIIDVQEEFDTAHPKEVVNACRREINRAKKLNAPIITITYDGEDGPCPNLPRVEQALSGYKKWHELNKSTDSGANEIHTRCMQEGLDTDLIRVCGVNITYCVRETVWGLYRKYPGARFEVVYDACNCSQPKDGAMALLVSNSNGRIVVTDYNRAKVSAAA